MEEERVVIVLSVLVIVTVALSYWCARNRGNREERIHIFWGAIKELFLPLIIMYIIIIE